MNEIIAKIDGGDLVFLALAALFTFGYVVSRVCAAFEPAGRIETAIKDATGDLLDALKVIGTDTTTVADACREQLERDREYRDSDQAIPDENAVQYEFVDLRKRE